MWPWASYFTSLKLFPYLEMGMVILIHWVKGLNEVVPVMLSLAHRPEKILATEVVLELRDKIL